MDAKDRKIERLEQVIAEQAALTFYVPISTDREIDATRP